jgi:hypothetical protein
LPYETVKRVVAGKTDNPYIETLDRFAIALGCSLGDILIGTKAVVGTKKMAELQEQVDILTAENATIIAERDFAIAETALCKEEVKALNAKIDLLTMQLTHKDELLALHNYYNKLNKE